MTKVFITNRQQIRLLSNSPQLSSPITIHFYNDCKLLLRNVTGITEHELSYNPSLKELYYGFKIGDKEISCCPEWNVKKNPNWFDFVEMKQKENEKKLAKEIAKRRFGL